MHIYIIHAVVSFRDRQHRAGNPRTQCKCTERNFSVMIIFHGANSLSAVRCRVCPGSEWPPVLFLWLPVRISKPEKTHLFKTPNTKKAMKNTDTISKSDTWAVCPECKTRLFPITPGAYIKGFRYQCRRCKTLVLIDTDTGQGLQKFQNTKRPWFMI